MSTASPFSFLNALNPSRWRNGSSRAAWIIASTIALFAIPLLVDLTLSPKLRPFGYVTSDTFYYLTLGRNFAMHGGASFDQKFPTDGFHPLWFLIVGAFYFVCDLFRTTRYFVLEIVLLSAAFIALAIHLLGRAMQDATGRLTPFFLLLPVGAYSLIVAPAWLSNLKTPAAGTEGHLPVYGTLWSYANGMETPLAIFVFALIAWLFCKRPLLSDRNDLFLGIALGALVLSRLDYVFIAASIGAGVFISGWAHRGVRRSRAATLALCFVAPIIVFLAINWLRVGHFFPVSATMKSTFPHLSEEHVDEVKALFRQRSVGVDLGRFHREAAIVVPMVVAFSYLPIVFEIRALTLGVAIRFRETTSRFDRFLGLVAPGVIVLGTYNFFFVAWWGIGHWYFGVPTLFVSLVAVSLLGRIRSSFLAPRARLTVRALFVAGALVLSVQFFVKLHRRADYHAAYAKFYWEEAPLVLSRMDPKSLKLIEFDDGIVGYSLGVPAMSGLGLALDPSARSLWSVPAFFSLAVDRGYDVVTTLVYQPHPPLPTEGDARSWVSSMGSFDPNQFDVSVVYASSSFTLVRLRRKG